MIDFRMFKNLFKRLKNKKILRTINPELSVLRNSAALKILFSAFSIKFTSFLQVILAIIGKLKFWNIDYFRHFSWPSSWGIPLLKYHKKAWFWLQASFQSQIYWNWTIGDRCAKLSIFRYFFKKTSSKIFLDFAKN